MYTVSCANLQFLDPTQVTVGMTSAHSKWSVECSEKTKSFNLKIPQPDSERRHSPDSKIVFEIMIGPFSFCEIGKT